MLFSGTAIANGSCIAVVTAIGMDTEIGRIQADITAAAEEDGDTPLKRKLNDFGELLAWVRPPVLLIPFKTFRMRESCMLIFCVGWMPPVDDVIHHASQPLLLIVSLKIC
jgi:magnesium-transporting ATPase (P-type)